MNANDTPQPPAELDRWHDSILLLEECDAAAGITTSAVVNARAAYETARKGKRQ